MHAGCHSSCLLFHCQVKATLILKHFFANAPQTHRGFIRTSLLCVFMQRTADRTEGEKAAKIKNDNALLHLLLMTDNLTVDRLEYCSLDELMESGTLLTALAEMVRNH
jgi:hypothetical protein